ncbi:MAG: M23 family metallopeptidase [Candidatus Paceibacterota bacterium]|jgi:murein DD-endopeptidase MepM/ murein hydrolase activator NlpD
MQSNQTLDDSLGQYNQSIDKRVKISLFFKPSIIKAYSFFIMFSLVAGIPMGANASFFSDWLGTEATANEEIVPNDGGLILNSQNIPLLESSINPDLKNTNDPEDIIIVQDDSFIYSNGFLGEENLNFEKSTISDKIIVYTVEEGDTLSEIAELFDVSMNTIRWENNLSGSTVAIGQKLNILPVTGVKHIVKSGDTISKIATKYEAESEDILVFNDFSKDTVLKKGDIIFVPNGIIKASVVKAKVSSGSSKITSSNTKAPSGYYLRPVSGIITSPYGSRRGGFHYGIDIGNKRGTPVVAAASGVVVKVVNGCVEGKKNCGGRYGNYIVISHENGTSTFYAHLSKTNVSYGQTVTQGQKIGAVGSTGRSTGPHLHFEIENANGSKMRPSMY